MTAMPAARWISVCTALLTDRNRSPGELISLKDGIVTVADETGETVEIPMEQISRAKLAVII